MRGCNIEWDKQDRSTGMATVKFDNPKNAEEAVNKLNHSKIFDL